MAFASEIVREQRSRGTDAFGQGHFGAARGGRLHQGLDIETAPGEEIMSPVDGEVIREALPYHDDPAFRGLVIRGVGAWAGYEVRIFYVDGLLSGRVEAGSVVGRAQDLKHRYPGITNHIHVEVRLGGMTLSPSEIYAMCF